jgi:hypothetical protein
MGPGPVEDSSLVRCYAQAELARDQVTQDQSGVGPRSVPAGAVPVRDSVAVRHLALAGGVDRHCDNHGDVDDAAALPSAGGAGCGRAEPNVGVEAAVERPRAEGGDGRVDRPGEVRELTLGQALDAPSVRTDASTLRADGPRT